MSDITTIPTVPTWEVEAQAHRPDLDDDLGGAVFQNHTTAPATDGTEPCAEIFNQLAFQVGALARVNPFAIFVVTFSGGVPSLSAILTCHRTLVLGDFTVVDTGTGDTSIRWDSELLPVPVTTGHALNENGTSVTIASEIETGLSAGTTGIRIRTYSGGVAANLKFTAFVY